MDALEKKMEDDEGKHHTVTKTQKSHKKMLSSELRGGRPILINNPGPTSLSVKSDGGNDGNSFVEVIPGTSHVGSEEAGRTAGADFASFGRHQDFLLKQAQPAAELMKSSGPDEETWDENDNPEEEEEEEEEEDEGKMTIHVFKVPAIIKPSTPAGQ